MSTWDDSYRWPDDPTRPSSLREAREVNHGDRCGCVLCDRDRVTLTKREQPAAAELLGPYARGLELSRQGAIWFGPLGALGASAAAVRELLANPPAGQPPLFNVTEVGVIDP